MHVIFVAPFFMDTTLRFVRSLCNENIQCSLLTQEPPYKVPDDLRQTLAGYCQIDDALDTKQIVIGAKALEAKHGRIARLFGALEHIQVQLADAREILGMSGLSGQAARNFRDKAQMKDVLTAAAIPCARHRLVQSSADAWGFAQEIGYPLVLKPLAGAGAKTTFRVDDDKQLAQALLQARPTDHHPAIVEEFMTGQEYSFETVCVRGEPVWHSLTKYLPNPLEAVRNPWIQWCVLLPREIDAPQYDDVRKVGFATVKALGQTTGLSHMEWFRRPTGGLAVSEIAARPPGAQICSLMGYATDTDIYQAWAHLMVFEEWPQLQRKFAVGAAFFRGPGHGRIKAIHGIETAQRELGKFVVETKLPRIGATPSSSYEGDGFAIVRHPDTRVVEQALKRLVDLVRIQVG
ncbi:MAG: ATP-grasp domain-containing protein [Myxococcales bacterium]|nr:ATP-grasp domain-containing protein [Myxococcales bacterium]